MCISGAQKVVLSQAFQVRHAQSPARNLHARNFATLPAFHVSYILVVCTVYILVVYALIAPIMYVLEFDDHKFILVSISTDSQCTLGAIGLLHKQLSIVSKFCMIDFKINSFVHFELPKPSFVPGISGMPETLPETSMPETLPTLNVIC